MMKSLVLDSAGSFALQKQRLPVSRQTNRRCFKIYPNCKSKQNSESVKGAFALQKVNQRPTHYKRNLRKKFS